MFQLFCTFSYKNIIKESHYISPEVYCLYVLSLSRLYTLKYFVLSIFN